MVDSSIDATAAARNVKLAASDQAIAGEQAVVYSQSHKCAPQAAPPLAEKTSEGELADQML